MAWKSQNWFVSPYNFVPAVSKLRASAPARVAVHDITLRDGEQQAGVIFRKEEKIQIARALDEAGVDRIEAGMPAVSKMDMEAVKAIAGLGLQAKVFSFARCMKNDVDLALQCDVDGVVMEIPSSGHIIKYAYGWSEQRAIDLAVEATGYAGDHGLHVAFFTIDSTRASFQDAWRLISAVAEQGHMDSLVLVDTFGVCSPHAIQHFVRKVKSKVRKPTEIHCHNDFGLAVANTIAAVLGGVETVHTTVNSIGERMGNASFEETIMALKLLYGIESNVRTEKFYELSKLIEVLSLVNRSQNKPVTGDNIFTTESGIIAGWWARLKQLNMPLEMFPYLPEVVGHPSSVRIVLGKKSGRDSILGKLAELGIRVTDDAAVEAILLAVKETSESLKRVLTDEEFADIVRRTAGTKLEATTTSAHAA